MQLPPRKSEERVKKVRIILSAIEKARQSKESEPGWQERMLSANIERRLGRLQISSSMIRGFQGQAQESTPSGWLSTVHIH